MRNTTFFAILIFARAPVASASEVHGMVNVVKGQVTIETPGKPTRAAKIGMKILAGDTIVTGKDSRAKIIMSDKNVFNFSPDSKIQLSTYINDPSRKVKKVEVTVIAGKVRASVEQKYDESNNTFQVKTPTAVAGVRGTDFITSFNTKTQVTNVVTFTGVVAVGLPGSGGTIQSPVLVRTGQTTQVSKGSAPQVPSMVPKTELNQLIKTEQTSVEPATPAQRSPTSNSSGGSDTPSSSEGSSMLKPKDLGPGVAQEVQFLGAPTAPMNFTPPNNGIIAPPSPFLNNANQSGKTKAIIAIEPL